jgi:hypothetical protein
LGADEFAAGVAATLGLGDLVEGDGVTAEEFMADGFTGDEADPVFGEAAAADVSVGAEEEVD